MNRHLLIILSVCGIVLSCNSNGKIEELVKEDVKEAAKDNWLNEERSRQVDLFNTRLEEYYEENADGDGEIRIENEWYDTSDLSEVITKLSGYMGIVGQMKAFQQYDNNPDCFNKDYSHYSMTWLKDDGNKPQYEKDYYDDQLFYSLWSCCGLEESEYKEELISIATFIRGRALAVASSYTPFIKGTEQLSSPGTGAYWRTETNNGVFFTKVLKGEDGEYECKTVDSIEKLNE